MRKGEVHREIGTKAMVTWRHTKPTAWHAPSHDLTMVEDTTPTLLESKSTTPAAMHTNTETLGISRIAPEKLRTLLSNQSGPDEGAAIGTTNATDDEGQNDRNLLGRGAMARAGKGKLGIDFSACVGRD
jgi:hypothetical protein